MKIGKFLLQGVIASSAFGLLATRPAGAEEPSDYDRALAAGYKAQFVCSGLWNGGKSLADIEADELTGIYDRVAEIVPTLELEIDQKNRQVQVSYSDHSPPRTALWNPVTGCTGMPIRFDGQYRTDPTAVRPSFDIQPWPMGDEDAMAAPSAIPKELGRVVAAAQNDAQFGGKTSAVLIIKNGRIIAETFKPGHDRHTAQRTWSVAKSIAGTLIGHAVHTTGLDIHAPGQIPEWTDDSDPRKQITPDQLMRMASGLTSDTAGNRTDPIYLGGASVTERTTSWPLLYRPGSRFRYANNDTLLAVHAARLKPFAPYEFFMKLGMTRTYAETDWQGSPVLSSQVWTTARDLGRLGLLYLNNGVWEHGKANPERLLPENWRSYVSTASGPQPERQFGYGATFWLMNKTDGVPPDSFAGFGNRGQFLVIIPSRDLVIVRRGYDTRANRFDIAAFTRAIVEATGS
ncbi:CubicO group peptidase, beta-lactamase class C family [Parasphingorhabdus marina DSM 22363]|uniref:CubicO group peptidase, beta-lactamase class C family n=1 Tax=Parasphingorhabdus marina DSM 22363 TaxID=1123272 RepID=A0A1N6F1F1_9SPHN|nr:serine hydrolase [Parasphingorhabdus marina]SIN89069.1 CubicO group peptidase, beta-lactamase class C family [Parasphingorhabdus marina DSM 22363]